MNKMILMLSVLFMCAYVGNANADTDASNLTYVSPNVARTVIEKHFGHFVSDNVNDYTSDFDDETVLADAVDAYNEMLAQNDGFVSVDGVKHVCDVAFGDLQPKTDTNKTDLQNQKCVDFASDLVAETTTSSNDCLYKVTKVDNSQKNIKYTKKDGSGFVRQGGTIPWRFFNPGALRGSPLSCTILSTKPNGSFAVFENAEIGLKALHNLLSTNDKYKGKTIAQAIRIYAPSQENNTARYINNLKKKGINVNKVLPHLTTEEWVQLEEAIVTLEGWHVEGTIETF